MPGIEALVMKAQLRALGWSYIIRMDNTWLQKILFFSELTSGSRNTGRPLKHFKDCLKASLRACGIPTNGWEALAADRLSWRQATHKGVEAFERSRLENLDLKRQIRKERRQDPSSAVVYPKCGRTCASAF